MKYTSGVTKEEAEFVKKMVLKCVRLLRKKEYELNLPTNAPDLAVDCLSIRRVTNGRSFAGAHIISINLIQYEKFRFVEYDSYAADKVIGTRMVKSREEYFMIKIAHEVAHHIQYRYAPYVKRYQSNWSKPHGDCFKAIYRYLRKDLINPLLE